LQDRKLGFGEMVHRKTGQAMKTHEIKGPGQETGRRSKKSVALPRFRDRAVVDEILRLAIHLDREDRDLLMAVYNDGTPARRLMRLMGVRCTTTVARRVRRALQRVADPRFRKVLASRDQWSAECQAVAERIWLRGFTGREAARDLGLSLHRVRQHVAAVRAVLGMP
jgi:DNA-directed RNA polymerase specialized sigma24 family protein